MRQEKDTGEYFQANRSLSAEQRSYKRPKLRTVIYYDIPCSVAVRGNQDLYEHHELQRKRETK